MPLAPLAGATWDPEGSRVLAVLVLSSQPTATTMTMEAPHDTGAPQWRWQKYI